ncbi:MAG: sugar ABC transporter permease [Caldilineaceae bacterium]|nr:sugar ABC transporter permease [Caldilineaceae bacterium]
MQQKAGPNSEQTGQTSDSSPEHLVESGSARQEDQKPGYAPPGGLLGRAFALIDRNLAYVLPAPAAIVILLLMGYPFFYTVSLSLQRVNVTMTRFTFVGAKNLLEVLTADARFLSAFWITLYFTVASLMLELVLAMIMALVMNRTFRGLGVIRTLFLLPLVATPTATSVIWLIMMEPSIGILNFFLEAVGLPRSLWVAGERSVVPSLVWINTWHGVPFVMLILLAGLRSLPTEPFEAARIDGASKLQEFFLITLPLLKGAIVVAMLFRAIDTLKVFDAIWIMTAGGPGRRSETLHIYSYLTAFEFYDLGYGSAVILVFMVIILVISAVLIRLRQRAWL